MNLTLTPFKAEDALEMLGKAAERYLDMLIHFEMDGPAFTGRLADGRVLGCAGMTQVAPWIADFWLIPSPWVKDYPVLFHKTVLARFRELVEQSTATRIQGVVDPRYPERVRWAERLGFVREGTMRKAGPDGQDLDLYALIREPNHGT